MGELWALLAMPWLQTCIDCRSLTAVKRLLLETALLAVQGWTSCTGGLMLLQVEQVGVSAV